MAPQSERHQIIVMNPLRHCDCLREHASTRARGCRALPGFGMLNDEVDDYAPIPDVVVRCGPMIEGGYARDPVLLAEILSPSTMNNAAESATSIARSRRSGPSRSSTQDEVRVEAWQREGGGWRRSVLKSHPEALALPELGGDLALSDLYEDLPLSA